MASRIVQPAWVAGALCGASVVAAVLAAYPFCAIGFMDDWSYIRTAQILASTGHLVYNGWATSIIGWQFYAGAMFLRLFGDSFTAARMSTVFVAFLTVWLFELTLEGFGLTRRNAVFGALTLGLSPLFLPLAASFMNDTNALLPLVLCCYLCQRALRSPDDRGALGWLALAAVTNALGGTVRQTAWLPGLFILPSTVWLMRHRRHAVVTGTVLWCLVAATVAACMLWWRQEPYSLTDKMVDLHDWTARPWRETLLAHVVPLLHALMTLALIGFPVLCAGFARLRTLTPKRTAIAFAAGMALAATLLIDGSFRYAWMAGVGAYMVPDWQALPWIVTAAGTTCIVGIAGPLFFAAASQGAARWQGSVETGEGLHAAILLDWPAVRIIALPYLLSYAALLATRPPLGLFDRYLLGVFPIGILCELRLYQDRIAPRLPAISYVALAGLAFVAVLGTHDWFAGYRALDAADRSLLAAGVSPTRISGPPEIDGITQLDALGHMDNPMITTPKGLYTPNVLANELPPTCGSWLADRVSVIHPEYVVRLGRFPCQPGYFESRSYTAWLPPFRRYVTVLKLPARTHE